MKIITIIPLQKGPFKENLTYFSANDVKPGKVVSVTLRNKKILGLAVGSEDLALQKSDVKNMPYNLKKIDEVKKYSLFSDAFLESAMSIGKYFASNNSYALASLIPSIYKENYDKILKFYSENLDLKEEEQKENLKTEKLLFQTNIIDRLSYYRTLVRSSFAAKKSVFIVLPTENDIEDFYLSLSKGIEKFAFTMHSGVSQKKSLEKLKQILTSTHPVLVIGTAPYLSIPRADWKTIVLEHESSKSYKMVEKPHFDLRIFVELFAVKSRAKLILGDSLLRLETIERKDMDHLGEVYPLSFRINFEGEFEIFSKGTNEAQESSEERLRNSSNEFKIFTNQSIQEIKSTLSKGMNVFIFSLRKGLATITTCRNCGEAVLCQNCGATLVLYLSRNQKNRMFACNRCKSEASADTKCANCSSWDLVPLGIGTDTVYEEAKKLFTKDENNRNSTEIKVFKIDKESTKTKKEASRVVQEFEKCKGAILVSTELGLFYLKDKVPLSVIASFDSLWSIPGFQMNERIIQLMLEILKVTKQKIIIQTKNDHDPALLAIKNESLSQFMREELSDRKKFDYPPYKRFIKIKYFGDKRETARARLVLLDLFKEYNPEIFSGFITKMEGKYSTNALIKLATYAWSLPEISANGTLDQNLFSKLTSLPREFEILVDPEDLL